MMGTEGISVADALALRNAGDNDGGFGGSNGAWWIIILILFGLGGWGRNGGFGGGNDGGYNACCVPATAQGVTDAFNFNQIDNGLRAISNGLCDGFYTTAQGINGINQSIATLGFNMGQGFCGVDKAILQSDFHNQAGFNTLGSQLASCCCELSRGQEAIRGDIAKAASELAIAGERNTNQILNYLTQTEMDKLRTELQSAQFQLSQLSQTSNIVNQLQPVARPAYVVASPYASIYGCGNGCGCGC